jgi:hypothetical protein
LPWHQGIPLGQESLAAGDLLLILVLGLSERDLLYWRLSQDGGRRTRFYPAGGCQQLRRDLGSVLLTTAQCRVLSRQRHFTLALHTASLCMMAVIRHHQHQHAGSIVNTESHSKLAAFIWSVADLLRGDFKQSQYGRIILSFSLLRRLESVLEPSKAAALASAQGHLAKPEVFLEYPERFTAAVTGKIDVRGWQQPAGSSAPTDTTQTEMV